MAFEAAVEALTAAGATIIDLDARASLPPADGESLVWTSTSAATSRRTLATRVGVRLRAVRCKAPSISNNATPTWRCLFNQDVFEQAESLAPDPTIHSRYSAG